MYSLLEYCRKLPTSVLKRLFKEYLDNPDIKEREIILTILQVLEERYNNGEEI